MDQVVDLAEVATVQAMPFMDADGDGEASDAEQSAYAHAGCTSWARQLGLEQDGESLALATETIGALLSPGEAGLFTLRIECRHVAVRPAGAGEAIIVVADDTFPDRRGWREITATAEGTTLLASDVPTTSISQRLTDYPAGRLDDPVDQRRAELLTRADDRAVVAEGDPVVAGRAAARTGAAADVFLVSGWSDALSGALGDRLLGGGLAVVALLLALALGALHALAPGHGKAVIAAYLVGQRGSIRHAAVLASSVALTHTAGVLLLGALLWTASVATPQRLYPVLGVASGAIVAVLGVGMLWRARRSGGRPEGGHHHGHRPSPAHAAAVADRRVRRDVGPPRANDARLRASTVVALSFAGGLVPTPSALLVLLGALTVGRLWSGVLLVAAYGVGMACALVGIGLAAVGVRGRLERRLDRLGSPRLHALTHALPPVTATFVIVAGLVVVVRSAMIG